MGKRELQMIHIFGTKKEKKTIEKDRNFCIIILYNFITMAATMLESITEKLTFPFPWWQMSLSNLYQVVFFIIAAVRFLPCHRNLQLTWLH